MVRKVESVGYVDDVVEEGPVKGQGGGWGGLKRRRKLKRKEVCTSRGIVETGERRKTVIC